MSPMKKPSAVEASLRAAAVQPAQQGDFAIRDDDQWRERQRKEARPARITLNLPADLNREFQVWLLNEAAVIGVPRISQQDALRIIIAAISAGPPEIRDKLRAVFREELR